jgi:hypothetical protein
VIVIVIVIVTVIVIVIVIVNTQKEMIASPHTTSTKKHSWVGEGADPSQIVTPPGGVSAFSLPWCPVVLSKVKDAVCVCVCVCVLNDSKSRSESSALKLL